MKFADFDLNPSLLQALDEMGYTAPTPIQEQTIPTLLQGGDVIGCAQTGTGKTAAFSLPVLQRINPGATEHPQALIITPTRELAEQIFKSIQDYTRFMPVRCVAVYGGVPSRGQEAALKKGVDIVVATPGRLLDLLQKPSLRLYDVRFLILDEADRMLDMGFIPDVENIVSYVPRTRQTLLFSATMPPEIEKLARKVTRTQSAEMIVVGERSSSADTVTQWICKVGDRDKMALLIELLKNAEMVSTIIFTRTKLGCAELSRRLDDAGISAMAIHSNLTQTQRQNALDRFKRGECQILVATDIAARGLDIEKVSHVINFDTPTHPEDYVHRVGRTGRALAKGEAFTFVSPAEIRHLKNIEKLIRRELPEFTPFATGSMKSAEKTAETQPSRSAKHPRKAESKSPSRAKHATEDTERSTATAHKPSRTKQAKEDTARPTTAAHKSSRVKHATEDAEHPTTATHKSSRAKHISEDATHPATVAHKSSRTKHATEDAEHPTTATHKSSRAKHISEDAAHPTAAHKSSRGRQGLAEPPQMPAEALRAQPVAVRERPGLRPSTSSEERHKAIPASKRSEHAGHSRTSKFEPTAPSQGPEESLTTGRSSRHSAHTRTAAEARNANLPQKPSHSAKMSKSGHHGSPTSSRFYRHDDDVDWLEED